MSEFAGYDRVGGRVLQFYATDPEIAEWLQEMLPTTFAPYSAFGRVWDKPGEQWRSFEYALAEIAESFARYRTANHWIRSGILSPGLGPGIDERELSFSGLIAVRLGHERDGRLWDAAISIVDRIRHRSTGEEIRQPEYLRIFERLRRSMRKRLVVETEKTFPDGSVSASFGMTARAADAHVRGEVVFEAEPVGLRS